MAITFLRRCNLPEVILDASPGRLLSGGMLLGFGLALWAALVHVGTIDTVVLFRLQPVEGLNLNETERTLGLGYIQQLNYGLWFFVGMPLLLASAAMGWTWWNRACESDENNIPENASLSVVSGTRLMSIVGIAVTAFFVGSSVQVELRDYKDLGLGWVQAKAIHDAAKAHAAIPGAQFRRFTAEGQPRIVKEAEIKSIDQPLAGVYDKGWFWGFVVTVKSVAGLWEATIIYLSLLYVRVGIRLVRYMKTARLSEMEGSVQWTVTPAIMMFVVGSLTNAFSIARYVANMAKGSYGSWDQYASFLVLSPGLATSVFGVVALYLVYFEARGKANPWAGTSQPYWWALTTSFLAWGTTSLGIVRLLIGLDPGTAQEVSEWLQHAIAAK